MSNPGASTSNGKLLTEFSAVTYDDWRKLVQAELKDVPFEKKMFSSTYEGIKLNALYRREDAAQLADVNSFPGFPPFIRGSTPGGYLQHPWDISQEIAFSSPTEFNNAARNFISRGLNALNMMLDRATRDGHDPDWAQPEQVGSGGLSIATLQDLEKALEGVDLEKTKLLIRCGASGMPMAALLVAVARKRKKTPASLRGCIETDPLGVLSHEGKLPQTLGQAYEEMAMLTKWASEKAPHLQTICVHSRAWHESGANAVQELAFTLATGVEYLRAMAQRDCPVDTTAPRIRFAVTVGTNFFMEIAKVRALRALWSRAVAAAGGSEQSQRLSLHIRTSQWNKSAVDPYNNMLRTTVEAFAGVIGGCDSMQVGAFDEVVRPPDDFSQRIARNTQLVLQRECNLDQIIDPAGGSWYVENLTAELAQRAWGTFQEIENLGGMEAALRAGFPQRLTTATAAEKLQNVAKRRDSIVGVNQYADAKQKPLERPALDPAAFHKRRVQQVLSYRTSMEDDQSEVVLKKLAKVINAKAATMFDTCVEAVSTGATLGEVTRAVRISDGPCAPIEPVKLTRAALGYEHARASMDAYAARTGKSAAAFLCNMGPLKEHKARADFSRGFLSAGGFDVISPEGFKSPEDAATAFAASGARVAVICSTDANYPALVPTLVPALRAKRSDAVILLAGYPADHIEAFKKAGVDDFIHIRADVLGTLNQLQKKLGIQ